MLSADGDTAMYLEYAHARVASILRKAKETAGIDVDAIVDKAASVNSVAEAASLFQFQHASELTLASDLMRIQDVLSQVQIDLFPHRLCEYLYFLAGRMTDFYRDCVILGEGTPIALRDSRLRLCSATAKVLKQGMGLLGITALDKI
jgi:arginyl-tRNA synthetase